MCSEFEENYIKISIGQIFKDLCLSVLEKVNEEDNFYSNVLFANESSFGNIGLVYPHNFDYCDS